MELKDMIAVMQHCMDGGEIEWREYGGPEWSAAPDPIWNWLEREYRVCEKKYRKATIEDAIRAIRGENVQARFRDADAYNWRESILIGYRNVNYRWLDENGDWWLQCEVLK